MSVELDPFGPYCRSCGADIKWAKTSSGKWMPVEYVGDEHPKANIVVRNGLVEIVAAGQGNYRPHFASCPDAGKWRHR